MIVSHPLVIPSGYGMAVGDKGALEQVVVMSLQSGSKQLDMGMCLWRSA